MHTQRSIADSSAPTDTVSVFQEVPQAPPDAIFNLTNQYKADKDPKKINIGVGAFRTDELKPYVLPVVKKVSERPPLSCVPRTRWLISPVCCIG